MAIDPSISLAVKAPQFANPLEQAGQALSLVNARQQGQMNVEKLQSERMANRETQLKQNDDALVTQAWQQAGGDPDKHVELLKALPVRPQAIQGLQKHYADLREQYAKTSKDESEVQKYTNSRLAGVTAAAIEDPNYEQNWAQYKAAAMQINPKIQLPDQAPPKDALSHIRLGYTTDEILHKEADQKRAAAKETREAAESAAKLPGMVSESAIKGQEATGTKPIQPVEAQRLAGEEATRAQTAVRDTNAEKRATELLKVSKGQLGVAQEHADIARKIYDQTYGTGANPALVGVEPKLRTQAATQAQKAADEFTKAMESSAQVQTFLDLARKGNKAAGSNLPMMGAESIQMLNGIKRINRSEIQQYEGAGSLLDSIQGKIGKIVSGQPIPADVMKDIESLHKAIAGNAATQYNTKLNGINQNYRSNFKPVEGPKSADAGAPVIRARDAAGKLHEAPAGTALPTGWTLEK